MNRDLWSKCFLFVTGAAIGSAVTWKVLKTKYEQLVQEEIESVREAFGKRASEDSPAEEEEDEEERMAQLAKELIEREGYAATSTEMEKEEENMSGPYIIAPDEFGECDYPMVSLTYYTDGVVTNEDGKIVENTDELVGDDFADHFGDYENDPDAVYVRNDEMGIDYEILKDYRPYSEIS